MARTMATRAGAKGSIATPSPPRRTSGAAKAALDRVGIPQEAIDRIAEVVSPAPR